MPTFGEMEGTDEHLLARVSPFTFAPPHLDFNAMTHGRKVTTAVTWDMAGQCHQWAIFFQDMQE